MAPSHSPDPVLASASEDSDSEASSSISVSDTEQQENHTRAPKRRRLSETPDDDDDDDDDEEEDKSYTAPAPLQTTSRIKKKDTTSSQPAPKTESNPELIRDALEIGLQEEESSFKALNVAPWLIGSLTTMAVRKPTAIQRACIPEILKGRDCIGGSRTGSGKTIAFAVPILQMWAQDPFGIFAVVLTPTRYVSFLFLFLSLFLFFLFSFLCSSWLGGRKEEERRKTKIKLIQTGNSRSKSTNRSKQSPLPKA